MLVVENTKENKIVRNVVSTMALEEMYLDEDFINELLKVSKGEKTTEQLIEEIKHEYGRQ
ncbi:MAG: antitoxin VbhA family protein [Lachnospiraceae bacterium]|jgi:hypothetical protein|nr:antitoxin VbhA family protein [Lachnospiraceae bacterium]MBF1005426.1 antitoxin VbhA family protein [Lachnospiraceae bacterium]